MVLLQRTILIVEDEPLIRLDLEEALADEGYRVLGAATVLEAIGHLARHPKIDGLVTDVDLPGGLSGLDLVELIGHCCPTAAIIVVSGRDHAVRADGPTPFRFFSKPYSMTMLLRALEEQILAKRPHDRVRATVK